MEENKNEEVVEKTNETIETVNKAPKKDNTNVIGLILLGLIVVFGLVYLFVLKPKYGDEKKEDNNGSATVLTEDEALTIAKAKLDAANNIWGDFNSDSEYCFEHRLEDDESTTMCYYGTKSQLEEKIHQVYSSKLNLIDLYKEYNITTKEYTTNSNLQDDQGGAVTYAFKDDDVYVMNSCHAEGATSRVNNLKIINVTENQIEAGYTVEITNIGGALEGEDSYTEDGKKIVLVKENNEWKISHASIFDACGFDYDVGK